RGALARLAAAVRSRQVDRGGSHARVQVSGFVAGTRARLPELDESILHGVLGVVARVSPLAGEQDKRRPVPVEPCPPSVARIGFHAASIMKTPRECGVVYEMPEDE